MARPRVAFLNASHNDEHTPRNFRREVGANLVEYDVTDGDRPESTRFDGVIVTGSRSSVYWDKDWIPPLCETVQQFVESNIPTLGVCFGHQVLAHALGGTVTGMDEYELGYREVRQVTSDPFFEDVPDPFLVFQTHSDTVSELPPEATLLAENERGVQAFRQGSAVGVQFHPEYDAETARDVTRRKDLPDDRIQSVLDGITDQALSRAAKTKALFDGFDRAVQNYRAVGQAVGDD